VRLLLTISLLGFAWFAAVNLIASAVVWAAGRLIIRRRWQPNAQWMLAMRLFPGCIAALFVAMVFLPAHLRFEPSESDESFGRLVLTLSVMAMAIVLRSLARAAAVAAVALRTRRVLAALPSAIPGDSVAEAYEVEHFAGLSLAGVFKTRILVGSEARRALTHEELSVALAHEHAHRASRDNIKRCAMFCAPDFFGWTSTARALEQRWRADAECRADARAVAGDERRAVQLASALIKVAKLAAGAGNRLASPVWSAFHEPMLLEARVRRLVSGEALSARSPRFARSIVVASVVALAWLGSSAGAAAEIHRATEALVHFLP
jgi:Zn-dependent protease with chaperone function